MVGCRKIFLILFFCQILSGSVVRAQETKEKLGSRAALDIVLKDEYGKDVSLRQIVDKPTILTLNYFRCAGICTPLLSGLAEALNGVRAKPGKDFQVITISFDPRDTPEMALQKRVNYLAQMSPGFPMQAWRFLTGDAAATKKLADSVGFEFHRQGDMYVHPATTMILSPEGIVTRYMYGISFVPADLEIAIRDAKGGNIRPSIPAVLRVCFS